LRHIAIDSCRNQGEGVVPWTVQGQAQEVVFQGMVFPTQFNPREIAISQPRCERQSLVAGTKIIQFRMRSTKLGDEVIQRFFDLDFLLVYQE
jgi:hypothetical protein